MYKGDFFLDYNREDLSYEFEMLIGCKRGIRNYRDTFLINLCLEGWLAHARRIIEAFRLKSWKKRHGLISEHLSHPKPSNRRDPRPEKRVNPSWDIETWHGELLDDVEKVAEQYKSDYPRYDLLVNLLKAGR